MIRPLLSAGPRSDASLAWMFPAHAMKGCTVLVIACVWVMSYAQQNVTTELSSKYINCHLVKQKAQLGSLLFHTVIQNVHYTYISVCENR